MSLLLCPSFSDALKSSGGMKKSKRCKYPNMCDLDYFLHTASVFTPSKSGRPASSKTVPLVHVHFYTLQVGCIADFAEMRQNPKRKQKDCTLYRKR